jgi:uncharacterized alpha-E superfamily protein
MMLSRVAENIYWMARHLERAENTARLVLVRSETRLDHPDSGGFYWEPALVITGTLEDYRRRGLGESGRDATNFLVSDPANPFSVLGACGGARENIRILRETLPRESWEAVQALHEALLRPGAAAPQRRDETLRGVIARLQGMSGLFLRAMNDDEGYTFLRLGRAIERGDFVARVLLAASSAVHERGEEEARAADWVGVLKSLTAYQMYRRSVRGPVTGRGVLRFLASSTLFPGALAYCAKEVEQATARLPYSDAIAARAARLSAALAAPWSPSADARATAALLQAAQGELATLHGLIAQTYLAPRLPPPATLHQTQRAR